MHKDKGIVMLVNGRHVMELFYKSKQFNFLTHKRLSLFP
jgi:hypothetical protein